MVGLASSCGVLQQGEEEKSIEKFFGGSLWKK